MLKVVVDMQGWGRRQVVNLVVVLLLFFLDVVNLILRIYVWQRFGFLNSIIDIRGFCEVDLVWGEGGQFWDELMGWWVLDVFFVD